MPSIKNFFIVMTILVLVLFCLMLGVDSNLARANSPKWFHDIHLPFDSPFPIYVACANDGAGEELLIHCDLHQFLQVHVDKNGVAHFQTHVNSQGGSAEGQTTHNIYRFSGIQLDKNFDLPPTGGTYCFHDDWVYTLNFIAKGKVPNITVHQVIRGNLCFDAEGNLISEDYKMLKMWANCQ